MTDLAARLPKAELHIHIEGSLEPEMMLRLAQRNGIALKFASVDEIRAAYAFTKLDDFLAVYYQGMSVLRTAEDFEDLAWAYLASAAADGVVHAEIFFDPQGHLPRGVSFDTVMQGLTAATARAERELGITSHLIMCFLRHLDEADAERTLDLALPYRDRVIGVGLDSSELGHPPAKFRNVFRRARDAGFRLVCHAGEEGPPDYVWEALDVLGVDRIDHGNRALEDASLVRRLAADGMALTVCPLSNLRLCVVDDMKVHPIRRMLEAGLVATVNSDDPSYFGGYVADNFRALEAAIGLAEGETRALVRNSFRAAFLPAETKARHLAALDAAG
ncbi:adenosine deaminase [Marinibaculum pumilum]|uniref:Adenine deaminase n=1 Tax=Marinibaculum pumilum TaxID=1766165 RepID=A0ABV7L092_9PROT